MANHNPSPLRYPGGKFKVYKYVKQLVASNSCSVYIEPYAGGAAVPIQLIINGDVNKVIINDFDRSIYAFWYMVKNDPDNLIEQIRNTDISIEEWYNQKNIQADKENVSLESLAFSTLYLNRVNRSGIIKAGVIGGKNQNSNYKMDCRFDKNKIIDKIERIADYSESIEIYNLDAIDFIKQVITNQVDRSFTFFDPPYYEKGHSLYTNFYKDSDHLTLSNTIYEQLSNFHWIITYDHHDRVLELYENYDFIEYYLWYTAQNKTKGIEYMFFSEQLDKSNPEMYLKLKEAQLKV